jgi:hypothetical protein
MRARQYARRVRARSVRVTRASVQLVASAVSVRDEQRRVLKVSVCVDMRSWRVTTSHVVGRKSTRSNRSRLLRAASAAGDDCVCRNVIAVTQCDRLCVGATRARRRCMACSCSCIARTPTTPPRRRCRAHARSSRTICCCWRRRCRGSRAYPCTRCTTSTPTPRLTMPHWTLTCVASACVYGQ